jgi:hypothetical protein
MAVEHVIDLGQRRYADREYEGTLPVSAAAAEQEQRSRRRAALLRLKIRSAADPVVSDLLIALGLDE